MHEEYDKIIDQFVKKYIDKSGLINYYTRAREIISDVNFIKEFSARVKKSSIDYKILPTQDCLVSGILYEKLFSNSSQSYWMNDEEVVIRYLKIIDITQAISSRLSNAIMSDALNDTLIEDVKEWNKVCKYWGGTTARDVLLYYIGSSWMCEQIIEKFDQQGVE